jgi:isoleucyl-tRNA synthetase
MKANLPQKEPEILDFWRSNKVYNKMVVKADERRKGRFILHDGPPYANGNIHHGHILNKVLKDIVVKFQNMQGKVCEFIPGWDCHGLPIEHAVEKQMGRDVARSNPKALREKCREFARHFQEIQSVEFERLGVLADFENPYLTMSYDYEALIAREFARFVGSSQVYLGKKPVLWCHVCETALAEAEVEYQESVSPSVWVRFPFKGGFEERLPELKGKRGSVVIWTTTPWTLPANLAIALHPTEIYCAVESLDEVFIVAKQRLDEFKEKCRIAVSQILCEFEGKTIEGACCRHPFIERDSLIIVGEHVTMDTGSGCVHTAPGHGEEDFEIGAQYGLEPYAPVDDRGRFTEEVPLFAGRVVFDCDKAIVELLKEKRALLHYEDYVHEYPHCWRSKNPVIFRATSQWFISVDKKGLRKKAIKEANKVVFIPSWGRARILGMLQNRPDWCISRQRFWGVPIVAVRCKNCHEVITNREMIENIAEHFEREGADVWFDKPLSKLLPALSCPRCKGKDLEKCKDILDVWFDSGVSYAGVIEKRYGLKVKTDLYLEGSDQHRGWFQSSLLASVGTRGQAPYKAVLTHGFVVDGQGKKLAKSLGNFIDPQAIIVKNGAEILRLWTAFEDYTNDIRLSDEILTRLVEAYRKIRNTIRFMLGVVSDFDPNRHIVRTSRLLPFDRYALVEFRKILKKVRDAYKSYAFHTVVRTMLEYATNDLSAFYLDIAKDRLYCGLEWGFERRSAQTAIYKILRGLVLAIAPVLSFTAEEAFQHMPKRKGDEESVFMMAFPNLNQYPADEGLFLKMQKMLEVRDIVLKALEEARVGRIIGHPLEACVDIFAVDGSEHMQVLREFEPLLPECFVVSKVVLHVGNALRAQISRAEGQKCQRCWQYSTEIPCDSENDDVCPRCAGVLDELSKVRK